jgi:hypothetical protein
MPRKTSFSIPMGEIAEHATQPKKTGRRVRATEVEVPLNSPKETKSKERTEKAAGSRRRDIFTVEGEAATSKQQHHNTEESYSLHHTEVNEELEGIEDNRADEGQSNVCTIMTFQIVCSYTLADTHGPVARIPEQISPPFIGDGRTHKGSKVFHVHSHHGSQVL